MDVSDRKQYLLFIVRRLYLKNVLSRVLTNACS